MLQKPDLQDELIVACLQDGYGLRVTQLRFLPLGADLNTAVYRASIDDDSAYFLKLRRGPFDEMTVAIPALLGNQGIREVIVPLRTTTGQLWHRWEPYTVTLYPFVQGVDAYHGELTEQQWVVLGAALKHMHTATLPPALRRALPRETYTPLWREKVRAFQERLRGGAFTDPVATELATSMRTNAAEVHELVEKAERLGRVLQNRLQERGTQEWVLCHGDIHAGNVLIGVDRSLYIVDWDTAVLAPKERDLMFVGSGLGRGWAQPRAVAWFYQGYCPGYDLAEVDPVALAYYRCERIAEDIAVECELILSTTEENQDRSQELVYFKSNFEPGGVVEIAQHSYRAAEALGAP